MIENKWLFIGTDTRIEICERLMRQEGENCRFVKTDVYSKGLEKVLMEFEPNHIIFPVLQMKDLIPTTVLQRKAKLYTGIASDEWLTPFKEAGLSVQSYLKEELYIWENARITAEAFLKEFYEETNEIVYGKKFYVAGFGRVGKMTAQLIRGMGGCVTIIARAKKELAEAKLCGFRIHAMNESLPVNAFYLVNTIPANWLKIEENAPVFIFDLASFPGCLAEVGDFEYYRLLPGLPGKHFPMAAAKTLKTALHRMNRE